MVLVDDKKYACETCIKGHRSSTCKHTDRPLFEIKKKGRPVTQCEHCRELRKSKQVHVKCLCESQDTGAGPLGPSSSKKDPDIVATGWKASLPSAVFPDGLPEGLEVAVARQPISEGLSDSDRGENSSSANSCSCKGGKGPCECCMPRKSAPRRRKSNPGRRLAERKNTKTPGSNETTPSSPPSSHVLARIAELRPVLPRPSSNRTPQLARFSHSSAYPYATAIRHHDRDTVAFSPYGRAYDLASQPQGSSIAATENFSPPPRINASQGSNLPPIGDLPADFENWAASARSYPSTCQCGEGCTCPGCVEHNGEGVTLPTTSAFSTCVNPGACSHCLDCTILSLPAYLPPNSTLSQYDAEEQAQSIDEWIRQISAANPSPNRVPFLPASLTTSPAYSAPCWEDSPMSDTNASLPSPCCSGKCQCSPERCACLEDCCGCCQGCNCDQPRTNTSNNSTFTTSGERISCCSGAVMRAAAQSSFHSSAFIPPTSGPSSRRMSSGSVDYLRIPDVSRSRASSTSSSQSAPLSAADFATMFGATPRPVFTRDLPSSDSSSTSSASPAPQLGMRITGSRSPIDPSIQSGSPIGVGGSTYATSVSDSEMSDNQRHYEAYRPYDPSLGAMHLY